MDALRYYYTVDGTAVRGPVDANTLRKLCEQRILTASSQLCAEGEQTWQDLVPERFAPSLVRDQRPASVTVGPMTRLSRPMKHTSNRASEGIGRLVFLGANILCGMISNFVWLGVRPDVHFLATHGLGLSLFQLGLMVASCLMLALRLQNVGHSRWWWLLIFVPFVGMVLFFYLLLAPGGSAGEPSSKTALVVAVVLMILFFIGMVLFFMHLMSNPAFIRSLHH